MFTVRWLALSVAGLIGLASFAWQGQPAINKRVTALETSVAALEKAVNAPKPTITAPALNQQQVDDLGLKYALLIDSKDFQILEWTAFINNGRVEFSGVSHLLPAAEPIEEIAATLRVYDKAGETIDVQGVLNVGFRLEPGKETRFAAYTSADVNAIGHYTVEFELVR